MAKQGWSGSITGAIGEVVEQLHSAKVAATADPTRLRIPGALVVPTSLEHTFGGCGQVTVTVYLVHPDPDRDRNYTFTGIEKLLDKALSVLDPDDVVELNNNFPSPTPATNNRWSAPNSPPPSNKRTNSDAR